MILTTSSIAEFAAQFIDNLDEYGNRQFQHAAIMVTDLDEDGDVRILLQATSDNHIANIQVLQAAQLQQTVALARQRQQFFEDDE